MERAVAQEQPGGRRADRRGAAPTGPHAGPDPARLVLCVSAEVDQLRKVRRRVERWLREQDVTEDALIDVQLALGEAVSNSMEHAYRDSEPGGVDIDLEVRTGPSGRELVARVTDRGRWKPVASRPGYRGRGLAMIDGLSDDMRVTSNRSGTEVGFTVPLDAG